MGVISIKKVTLAESLRTLSKVLGFGQWTGVYVKQLIARRTGQVMLYQN